MPRWVALLALPLAGCPVDTVCTTEAVVSVLVTITDSQGAEITEATVTWSLADAEAAPQECDHLDGNQWACGYEAAGALEVSITEAGPYEPFLETVEVTSGECHVETVELDAVLQYLPD